MTEKIQSEKIGKRLYITFNDPETLNSISLAMWQTVTDLLTAAKDDPEVNLVVFQGAGGKSFASGANISEFEQQRTQKTAVDNYEVVAEGAQMAIFNFPKPTVALINGYCIGGGLNIALCCDLRYASEKSIFSIPAGRLGLGYRFTALRNLVHTAGHTNALEIFLTGKKFGAQEAKEKNIINNYFSEDDLNISAEKILCAIEDNAPLTLAAGKKLIKEIQKSTDQLQELSKILVKQCFESQDYQEGKIAFKEKRKPQFCGI